MPFGMKRDPERPERSFMLNESVNNKIVKSINPFSSSDKHKKQLFGSVEIQFASSIYVEIKII